MSRVLTCAHALASQQTTRSVLRNALVAALALAGCDSANATDPAPSIAVLGESTRLRLSDALPRTTPWFDGTRVSLVAARGETIGLQIIAHDRATLSIAPDPANASTASAIRTRAFDVESFDVKRPSTALYGGSHGKGRYADGLVERTPASSTALGASSSGASSMGTSSSGASGASSSGAARVVSYVEVIVSREAREGVVRGELAIGSARYPVELQISHVTLPDRAPRVWAYQDPRELAWHAASGASTSAPSTTAPSMTAKSSNPSRAVPSADERACTAMFREHGVLLSPDIHIDWWPTRKADFAGIRDVPVVVSADPAKAGDEVRAWIAATKGTGHVPFAIPIDEPRTPKRIQDVVALGKVIRAAGGGPSTFRFAVTANPRPEWVGLVDQFIQLKPAAHSGAWAYNGIPPYSGTMVLDAETPGTRTWGWIAHRDGIAQWYAWDALYWHDRHNRKGAPLPGRKLDLRDPVSFDDGEDRGNLDGVLALPGCQPTLRLAALRRGQQDRALLELAQACDPLATSNVVARTIGDRDESVWERSRRELIRIASCR